ncbi:MAG: hypothetical protein JWQ30_1562 [Sediminibacterium sp.]|nr:hypothetical protein [Sediminibacterium sp.]
MKYLSSISRKKVLAIFVVISLVKGSFDFVKGFKKGWNSVHTQQIQSTHRN